MATVSALPAAVAQASNGTTLDSTVSPPQNGLSMTTTSAPSSLVNKRKRDDDNSHDESLDSATPSSLENQPNPTPAKSDKSCDEKLALIRDFFETLRRYDLSEPPLLTRPIPSPPTYIESGDELAKRKKLSESPKATIEHKIAENAYGSPEQLVTDILRLVGDRVRELESQVSDSRVAPADAAQNQKMIAQASGFAKIAQQLLRREMSYPSCAPSPPQLDCHGLPNPPANQRVALTTFTTTPAGLRPVYSSLELPSTTTLGQAECDIKTLTATPLPPGFKFALVEPTPSRADASRRSSKTLGELFPPPRNLRPLSPPKVVKPTTKDKVLGFYHPELAEKPKYSELLYQCASLPVGQWLDYSNATPSSQTPTKQRARAQSLAGHKPSTEELEVSELESQFRSAFSSFAPSRDDSAALIPSGTASQIHWQRIGRWSFERLVDAKIVELDDDANAAYAIDDEEVDMDEMQVIIDNWEQLALDPSLDQALGKKASSDHDKDVNETLQEVSDLIETLISYQRNRNLTMPTSQDRSSTDPVDGDMLRSGVAAKPSDEEMLTYQTLKAQLVLIIQTLPPYAVTRLNSDKLGDLDISTKISLYLDEHYGTLVDDPPRPRVPAPNTAATTPVTSRQAYRPPGDAGALANHAQYSAGSNMQYAPSTPHSRSKSHLTPQAYAQATPMRPPGQNLYAPQRPQSAVPVPQPPQGTTQFRTPGRYALGSYSIKAPPPQQQQPQISPHMQKSTLNYGQGGALATSQPRLPAQGTFNNMPQASQGRYVTYPASYSQNHQQHLQQQSPSQQQQQPQMNSPHPQHLARPAHASSLQHMQQQTRQSPHLTHQHLTPMSPQHTLAQNGYAPYASSVGARLPPRTMSPQVPPQHLGQQQPQAQQAQNSPHFSSSPSPAPSQSSQIGRPGYTTATAATQPMQHRAQVPPSRYGAASPGVPMTSRPAGLTGYHTVMPEGQQQRLVDQVRARASMSAAGGSAAELSRMGIAVNQTAVAANKAAPHTAGVPTMGVRVPAAGVAGIRHSGTNGVAGSDSSAIMGAPVGARIPASVGGVPAVNPAGSAGQSDNAAAAAAAVPASTTTTMTNS